MQMGKGPFLLGSFAKAVKNPVEQKVVRVSPSAPRIIKFLSKKTRKFVV
jgi:hypothetical protein